MNTNNNIKSGYKIDFITMQGEVKTFFWQKGNEMLEKAVFQFVKANYDLNYPEFIFQCLANYIDSLPVSCPFVIEVGRLFRKWCADLKRHKNMIRIESKK